MRSPATFTGSPFKRGQFRPPRNLRELVRNASASTRRVAVAAVAVAWVPLIVLCTVEGLHALRSVLLDVAAQTRLLIVIPLLVLTEPLLDARLDIVAKHFVVGALVKRDDIPLFEKAFAAFRHGRDSRVARVILVLLVYGIVALSLPHLRSGALAPWCVQSGGGLSLAGTWYIFVSLPIVVFLLLRWVWTQVVWGWFLNFVSRLDLQLIPAHPDRTAGLGFVETCLRGYLSFAFAIGTIAAGGMVSQMTRFHRSLLDLKHVPLIASAIIVIVCAGPLCCFWGLLLRTRRRGIFDYGALTTRLGQQFEKKWLSESAELDQSVLEAPDFSAATDLYAVAANVHRMTPLAVPVGVESLARLVVATVLPAIPISLAIVPFDAVLKALIKFIA